MRSARNTGHRRRRTQRAERLRQRGSQPARAEAAGARAVRREIPDRTASPPPARHECFGLPEQPIGGLVTPLLQQQAGQTHCGKRLAGRTCDRSAVVRLRLPDRDGRGGAHCRVRPSGLGMPDRRPGTPGSARYPHRRDCAGPTGAASSPPTHPGATRGLPAAARRADRCRATAAAAPRSDRDDHGPAATRVAAVRVRSHWRLAANARVRRPAGRSPVGSGRRPS